MISSSEDQARTYGYARRSSDGQILSIEAQKDRIQEKAESLDLSVDYIYEETESAREVAWDKRPIFVDLCNALRKDDVLIVWQIERMDRNFWRAFDVCRFLAVRNVRLIVLDSFFNQEIDLHDPVGQMFLAMGVGFSTMVERARMDAVKRGISLLQQGELWYRIGCSRARFGRRWVDVEVGEDFKTRRSGSTHRQREAWDEHECNLIREVWVRWHCLHQSDAEIGRIFLGRDERTPEGSPWVKLQAQHRPKCRRARPSNPERGRCYAKGCPVVSDYSRIKEVRVWLDDLIANGVVPDALKITPATIGALKEKIAADTPVTQAMVDAVKKRRAVATKASPSSGPDEHAGRRPSP
jgi:DNA invertase Pin-like site-specific DNA recombinase